MSSQMPELGSKISLISKADIRYEGRLFQVDPQECTIALANVRSYGTEDRETHYPVPAQSQIYEYILFRGSDIKDIRVINSTIHQDPAIVQLVPPVMNQQQQQQQPQPQQQQTFQSSAINHAVLGQTTSNLGSFPSYGVGLGLQRAPGSHVMQPSELAPGPHTSEPADKEPDLIGGVSRSTTPSLTRKSPTNDQGTQVNSSPPRDQPKKHPRPIQPPNRDRDSNRRDFEQMQPRPPMQRGEQQMRRPFQDNIRGDYRRPNLTNRNPHFDLQAGQFRNKNPREMQGGWMRNPVPHQQRQQRGGRSRGPPRSGAPQPNKKNQLKFESDYDFDKANNEFEELRSQIGKLKVGVLFPTDTKVETEKKEDSGNETGTGEPEPEEEVFYDKKKSFFDSISCEAVERSKGRSQRTDWRTERKLNTETFGPSASRRGMFRGRGYYGGPRNYGYRPRNYQNHHNPIQSNDPVIPKTNGQSAVAQSSIPGPSQTPIAVA